MPEDYYLVSNLVAVKVNPLLFKENGKEEERGASLEEFLLNVQAASGSRPHRVSKDLANLYKKGGLYTLYRLEDDRVHQF